MLKKRNIYGILLGAFLSVSLFAAGSGSYARSAPDEQSDGPQLGAIAPSFNKLDTNGVSQSLEKYKDKIVVLEWTNHNCPYVRKHYDKGNMQALQQQATQDGVIWLTIVSSAQGKQGYTTPEQANQIMQQFGTKETARILDSSGDLGRLYGAKTTPHMFVVDRQGQLAYKGAIDSDSSANPNSIAGATNYVREAITALKLGQKYSKSTVPYGCGVKY